MTNTKIEKVTDVITALEAVLKDHNKGNGYIVIYADGSGHISPGLCPDNNTALTSFRDIRNARLVREIKLIG